MDPGHFYLDRFKYLYPNVLLKMVDFLLFFFFLVIYFLVGCFFFFIITGISVLFPTLPL